MRIANLTPGTGSFYCGSCLRDHALVKALRKQRHDAYLVPLYLPLVFDDRSDNAGAGEQVLFGGVNVYLEQKYGIFRHTPRFIDDLLNSPAVLRLASKRAGMTQAYEIGEMTVSMIKGEEGKQKKELDKLIEFLGKNKPDAVCLSNSMLAGGVREIKRKLGIPVIVSLQGEDSYIDAMGEPWATQAWDELAIRAKEADALVAPSKWYAEVMAKRLNVEIDKITVIHNGIDPTPYVAPASEPPTTIGYLARLCKAKGLQAVVEAFFILKKQEKYKNLRLRCAGVMLGTDKPFVETLKDRARDAKVLNDIDFAPNLEMAAKIGFLGTISVMCVPATYGEAFGLYTVEAMAMGVPLVLPKDAAFPEIIEKSGAGITYETGDVELLAAALESMLDDTARAKDMGKRGKQAVADYFNADRMAKDFAALCAKLTGKPAEAPAMPAAATPDSAPAASAEPKPAEPVPATDAAPAPPNTRGNPPAA